MTTRLTHLALLVLCAFVAGPQSPRPLMAADETVTFTFAPTAGTVYDELLTRTWVTKYQETTQKACDAGAATTRVEKDADGFRYETTITDLQMTRNGVKAPAVFTDMAKGLVLTTHVDGNGQFTGISGDDKFRERIETRAPKEAVKAMLEASTHEVLLKRERQDWHDRIGRFVGRTTRIAELWIDTTEYRVPSGILVPVYRATQVEGWTSAQDTDVVRVTVTCHSTAVGLAKEVGKTAQEVTGAVPQPLEVQEDIIILSKGQLILDPKTMRVFGETIASQYTLYVVLGDGTRIPIETTENKAWRITYRL